MPTIGKDCQLILDSVGYLIEPNSYGMARPRIRRADLTRQPAAGGAGAGERYVDSGPGKREWSFVVVCDQTVRTYTGQTLAQLGLTGQSLRDALHASYEKVATVLPFTDPHGQVWSVHFDDLTEAIADIHSQAEGNIRYLCHVTLVEA